MSSTIIKDEYFVRERKHRLKDDAYKGYQITAYTLCIKDRKQIFNEPSLFTVFEEYLHKALAKHHVDAHVYVFMPDHCHLLLQSTDKDGDTKKAVILFKQLTGYWFSKNLASVFCGKDFYDHLLRKDEDLKKQIEYILLNPVRGELVETWQLYPLKGSTIYDLESWS